MLHWQGGEKERKLRWKMVFGGKIDDIEDFIGQKKILFKIKDDERTDSVRLRCSKYQKE